MSIKQAKHDMSRNYPGKEEDLKKIEEYRQILVASSRALLDYEVKRILKERGRAKPISELEA